MTVTAEDLDMSRLALEVAVDQLTRPARVRLERPEGVEIATTAPLLEQVESAVEDNSGPSGPSVAKSKPPLRIDALDLLREVDVEVGSFARETRAQRVRAWSAAGHAAIDGDALRAYVAYAEGWVRRARALLDPSPPWRLRGKPCPKCGATRVESVDDCGEVVDRPPLEVDREAGVLRCVAPDCDLRVAPDGWGLIAAQIAQQTETETLQEESWTT